MHCVCKEDWTDGTSHCQQCHLPKEFKPQLDFVTSTQLAKACYDGYTYYLKSVISEMRQNVLVGFSYKDFDRLSYDDKQAWYYAAANVKDLLMKQKDEERRQYWKDKDYYNSDFGGPSGL